MPVFAEHQRGTASVLDTARYTEARRKALGGALRSRREDDLDWAHLRPFALQAGGMSYTILRHLEKGDAHRYDTLTVQRAEDMYELAPGAITAFLDAPARPGPELTLASEAPPVVTRSDSMEMLARFGLTDPAQLDQAIATLTTIRDAVTPAPPAEVTRLRSRRAAG